MNIFLKRALKKEAKKYLTDEQQKEVKKSKSVFDLSDDTMTEIDNICLGFAMEIVRCFE